MSTIFDMGRTMKLIDEKLYVADPQPPPVIPIGLDPDMPDDMLIAADREAYVQMKAAMQQFIRDGDADKYKHEVLRLAPRIGVIKSIGKNDETKTDTQTADLAGPDTGSAEE